MTEQIEQMRLKMLKKRKNQELNKQEKSAEGNSAQVQQHEQCSTEQQIKVIQQSLPQKIYKKQSDKPEQQIEGSTNNTNFPTKINISSSLESLRKKILKNRTPLNSNEGESENSVHKAGSESHKGPEDSHAKAYDLLEQEELRVCVRETPSIQNYHNKQTAKKHKIAIKEAHRLSEKMLILKSLLGIQKPNISSSQVEQTVDMAKYLHRLEQKMKTLRDAVSG